MENEKRQTEMENVIPFLYVEGDAQLRFHVPFKSLNSEKLPGEQLQ